MSVPAKLAGFAVVLLAVFAIAFGVGAATEPDAPGSTVTNTPTSTTSPAMDMDHGTEHGS